MDEEYYYRYEERLYSAGLNEMDNPIKAEPKMEIVLYKFKVIKRTEHGLWITPIWDDTLISKKFIYNKAKRKYASPTKTEALESFKRRKISQIKTLEAQLERAKKAYQYAISMEIGD